MLRGLNVKQIEGPQEARHFNLQWEMGVLRCENLKKGYKDNLVASGTPLHCNSVTFPPPFRFCIVYIL